MCPTGGVYHCARMRVRKKDVIEGQRTPLAPVESIESTTVDSPDIFVGDGSKMIHAGGAVLVQEDSFV